MIEFRNNPYFKEAYHFSRWRKMIMLPPIFRQIAFNYRIHNKTTCERNVTSVFDMRFVRERIRTRYSEKTRVEKMDSLKWLFLILLVMFCLTIRCSDARLKKHEVNFDSFDFDKMKMDLFTKKPIDFDCEITTDNDYDCLNELVEIGDGLKNRKQWALKSIFNKFVYYILYS